MPQPRFRKHGLRVVVDSNMLQSGELEVLLSATPTNKAVLTDYAWMEAYKVDPVRSIQERLSVLRRFPDQVLVLKGTRKIAALDARAPGLADRMVWPRAGRELQGTFTALDQAKAGDPRVIAQILEHGLNAQQQMTKIQDGVPDILGALPEMREQLFTDAEVRRARTGGGYSRDMVMKILGGTDQIFEMLLKLHPDQPRRPTRNSRVNMYLYRYALASTLYLLRWIRIGSPKIQRHDKVRNDFIDLTFATLGTYFNGLMTEDERARSVHLELRVVLDHLGARMPDHYVEHFIKQLDASSAEPSS